MTARIERWRTLRSKFLRVTIPFIFLSPGELLRVDREIAFDAGSGPKSIDSLGFVTTRQYGRGQTRIGLLTAAVIALVAVWIEVAAALYASRSPTVRRSANMSTMPS